MKKLYTQTRAAELLGISRHAIQDRITSLERRGKPLSAAAGDIVYIGKSFKLTVKGLRRLRNFTPGYVPRTDQAPPEKPSEKVLLEVKRRARRHLKLFSKEEINWKGLIAEVQADLEKYPEFLDDNWETPPPPETRYQYGVYISPTV